MRRDLHRLGFSGVRRRGTKRSDDSLAVSAVPDSGSAADDISDAERNERSGWQLQYGVYVSQRRHRCPVESALRYVKYGANRNRGPVYDRADTGRI